MHSFTVYVGLAQARPNNTVKLALSDIKTIPLISEFPGFPNRVMTKLHLNTLPDTTDLRYIHSLCNATPRLLSTLRNVVYIVSACI